MREKAELLGGELERLVLVADLEALAVEQKIEPGLPGGWRSDGAGASACRALQDGPYPSRDLSRAEGLHDVVVGADLQPHHAIDLLRSSGQEQHGNLRRAPNRLADLEPAHVWKAHV